MITQCDAKSFMLSPSPQSPRSWQFYFGGLAVVYAAWLVLAYLHLVWFSVPTMDGWCYYSPAIYASVPLVVDSPLLGDFAGLNQTWGLHWPGVVWLHSMVLAWLPESIMVHALYFLAIWSLVAAMLAILTWRLTANAWFAGLIFVFYLVDRAPFYISHFMRPEMMLTLVVVLATWALLRLWREDSQAPRWLWGVFLAFCYLLPLLHPIGCIFAAGLGLFALLQWWGGRWSFLWLVGMAGAMVAGLLTGVAAIYGNPAAWDQFQDHAAFNQIPFSWGGSLIKALLHHYAPLYIGISVFVLGLVSLGYFLVRYRAALVGGPPEQGEGVASREAAIVAWLALCILLGAQFFHNLHYVMVVLPLILLLAITILKLVWERSGTMLRAGLLVAILLAGVINGAFWPWRTLNYVKLGTPNLRGELVEFYEGLPDSPRMGVPIVLWEAAAIQPRSGVFMTTLPHNATKERREAYERYVGEQLRAGDLLIIDDKYGLQPTFELDSKLRLEPVARLDRRLKFRKNKVGGFDLKVYRLVDVGEASEEAILPPAPGKRRAPYFYGEKI